MSVGLWFRFRVWQAGVENPWASYVAPPVWDG